MKKHLIEFYDTNHQFQSEDKSVNTEVLILDEDTFTIAASEPNAVCLNFASQLQPGGGYKSVMDLPMPIKTQEEDLFRRSNLPELLDNEEVRNHYPLMGIRGLYCKALVHKDKFLQPIEPFETGVITLPAVIKPSQEIGTPSGRSYKLVEAKVRRIVEIAVDQQHEVLILGAWGCGVFGNDPKTIAELFLKYVSGRFQKVVFGIPGKESQNHRIFQETVQNYLTT